MDGLQGEGRASAGLGTVEAPGQQKYRKYIAIGIPHEHISSMIVRTCVAYASIQNVEECS